MNIDKKTITIIILSIALAIVSYIAFGKDSPEIDNTLIENQLKAYKQENDSLIADASKHLKNAIKYEAKIDSLEKLKPQIKLEYEKRYTQIDNANINSVVNDFKGIFADNNIGK